MQAASGFMSRSRPPEVLPMQSIFNFLRVAVFALVAMLLPGCVSRPLAPPMSFTGGDWVIRQGTATWTSRPGQAAIPGNLVVAMTVDGRALVQFSTPTDGTLALAQFTTNYWQVQYPPQGKSSTGGRSLPDKLLWLQLPAGLLGNTTQETDWIFSRQRDQTFVFRHEVTGERLEGRLVTTHLPAKHFVGADEHIVRVARRYGCTVDALRAVNPGSDIEWFKPGNVINLPPPPPPAAPGTAQP